jgi:lipopolysaccharide biosynthesis glycosyltransferase
MKYRIAVLYTCDKNYHELTLYSLASIARVHRSPLDFHIVQVDYEQAISSELEEFVSARGHRLIRTISPATAVKSESRKGSSWEHITDVMFHKSAAIHSLTQDYDYIVYVDGDILAFGELQLDALAGFDELCAACLDIPVTSGIEHADFHSNCERNNASPDFFNTGVIMVNASKWLGTKAHERFIEALARHAAGCPYFRNCILNDQCVFNMVVAGDFLKLPLTLNMQQGALHTRDWATAIIRHYSGPRKFLNWRPWTCDPRQHRLLHAISRETGLRPPSGIYDFGVSYQLNGVRRRGAKTQFEHAIEELSRGAQRQRPMSRLSPERARGPLTGRRNDSTAR